MKTAISVPDAVFERVDARAQRLGVSRSEFFARAAERYLRELDEHDLTARINAAIEQAGVSAAIEQRMLAEAGLRSLHGAGDDDW